MVAVLDRQAPQSSRIGLAGILGLTSASMLLLTAAFVTNVYADYGMAALPLVFLFAGNLVQLVVNRASSNRLASGVVTTAVLTAGVLPGTVSHLSDGSRFDYRLAYQHVRRVDPSIPVFTTPMVLQQHYAPDLTAFPLDGEPRQLESTLAREGELWAVVSVRRYGILGDGTRFLERWLAANCRLELSTERPRLDYRRYRVELHRCSSGPNQSPEGALEIEGR